jgi:hypothetical protein
LGIPRVFRWNKIFCELIKPMVFYVLKRKQSVYSENSKRKTYRQLCKLLDKSEVPVPFFKESKPLNQSDYFNTFCKVINMKKKSRYLFGVVR